MANEFVFSERAYSDLTEIWNYSATHWSESQADGYFRQIIKACQRLCAGELSGRSFGSVVPGVSGLKVGRHIIFYRLADMGGIEVLRILHEMMDWQSHIDPGSIESPDP